MAELSGEARVAEWLDFPPGATLLMFTDGVTEARDASGAFYPLDARLSHWARLGPRELLDTLHADLEAFSGGVRRDDIAAITLRATSSGARRPETAACRRRCPTGRRGVQRPVGGLRCGGPSFARRPPEPMCHSCAAAPPDVP